MTIAGYTSRTSVAQGERLGFHLDNAPAKPDPTVRITVARIGDVAPLGFADSFAAGHHPTPPDAYAVGCGWPEAYALAVPRSFPSGYYTATLTNADGESTLVGFVVRAREPGSTSKIVLCLPVTTWQAYNEWGGGNLYGTETTERARRVSFDRPGGTGPWRARSFLLWLAKRGVVVEYATSIDLHADARLLDAYQLYLSAGHDEYWTKEMRDHVEGFVRGGGNAAFFSGNVSYWQARLEDDARTLVCYRDALEDPLTGVDDARVTVEWASAPVNRPENRMTGVGFRNGAGNWVGDGTAWRSAEYRVNFPEHWVFEGTGLALGQAFARGSVGYEVDGADLVYEDGIARATGRDGAPTTFVVLAVADLARWRAEGQGGVGTMGTFQSVGTVFTAASTSWTDTFETSPAVDRITHNVVTRLSRRFPERGWQRIGDAAGVVAMTAAENELFAVTADGALLSRDPSGQNLRWREVGVAHDVIALSSNEAVIDRAAGLVLVTRDGRLLWREPVRCDVLLHPFGGAADIVAIAAGGVMLFAVTRAGRLVARPTEGGDLAWKEVGAAEGVTMLATQGRKLWAVTADGRLLHRDPVLQDVPWIELARDAADVVALAGEGGKLFAATSAGAMIWRDAF